MTWPARVVVTGSRDWTDVAAVVWALSGYEPQVLIHGAARGLDSIAADVALLLGVPVIEAMPADWVTHGKAAGTIRNQRMLDEGRPDLVIAFPLPHSIGTRHMIGAALRAGVPVTEVRPGLIPYGWRR